MRVGVYMCVRACYKNWSPVETVADPSRLDQPTHITACNNHYFDTACLFIHVNDWSDL